MARYIITPPDIEFDRSIPKVFIRNCNWTAEQVNEILSGLDESKVYDIYIYNDLMNDIQWAEGIRTQAVKVLDCNHYTEDPKVWVKRIDDEFTV